MFFKCILLGILKRFAQYFADYSSNIWVIFQDQKTFVRYLVHAETAFSLPQGLALLQYIHSAWNNRKA